MSQEIQNQNNREIRNISMEVDIAGVKLKNPVMEASGTFGSGEEYSEFVDLNQLGAVVTKGVANVPWPGNPTPRIAETYGGMINAIGLQNPGVEVFAKRDIPFLKKYDTKIVVNVCGKTTEDGSVGTKGNVLDAIRGQGLKGEIVYACGPTPMLRALKGYGEEMKIPCWISLEERMACGIGACLACVCKSKEVDGHTNVHNKRICKEGPVFDAREVEL